MDFFKSYLRTALLSMNGRSSEVLFCDVPFIANPPVNLVLCEHDNDITTNTTKTREHPTSEVVFCYQKDGILSSPGEKRLFEH